jgi:hypothetical protein
MQPENKINYYLGNSPAFHFVRITHGLWRLGLPKNQTVREPRKTPKDVIPAALNSRMAARRESISSLQNGNLDFRLTSFADEKRFAGMTNEKAVIRGSRQ